jgi:NADH-quinone oxidoreductase subunit J
VVMMLDINTSPLREGFVKYLPLGVTVALLIFIEMGLMVGARHFGSDVIAIPARHPEGYSNVRELGGVLYTDYVYPFEIAAVILLVAIIAAIALTMRKRPETKYQDPSQQVTVKRADRVRLVSMRAEEKDS